MDVITEDHLASVCAAGACKSSLGRYRPGLQLSDASAGDLSWVEANLPVMAREMSDIDLYLHGHSGSGYGYGYGYGDGYGYGYGYGDGSGYGYGYGDGYGDGSGNGSGDGSGYGE